MGSFTFFFLCLFVASIPLENAYVIEGVGAISRIMGLLVVAFYGLELVQGQKIRKIPKEIILFLAYVVYSLATAFWSADSALTLKRFETNIQLIAMMYLIWQVIIFLVLIFRICRVTVNCLS